MRNAVAFADAKCYAECDTDSDAKCHAKRYAECDTNSYSAASNTEAAPDSAPSADTSLRAVKSVKKLEEAKRELARQLASSLLFWGQSKARVM